MHNNLTTSVPELSTASLSAPLAVPVSNHTPTVRVVEIKPSRKPNALADVAIQLTFGTEQIIIADFRVLRNKQGGEWVAPPSYSVTLGKTFEYFPVTTFNAGLKRTIEDEILTAFSAWEGAK